jgi:hypothetical protein
LDLSSDKEDAHLNISRNIFTIVLLHSKKPEQESSAGSTQPHTGQETHQPLNGEGKRDRRGEHTRISPKEQKAKSRRQPARSRPDRRLQKGKMVIIMMAFNQGAKDISVDAYTRCAPQLQPGQVIFKRIGDTTYRLEYANIEFDLDTHLAEQAVRAILMTL